MLKKKKKLLGSWKLDLTSGKPRHFSSFFSPPFFSSSFLVENHGDRILSEREFFPVVAAAAAAPAGPSLSKCKNFPFFNYFSFFLFFSFLFFFSFSFLSMRIYFH